MAKTDMRVEITWMPTDAQVRWMSTTISDQSSIETLIERFSFLDAFDQISVYGKRADRSTHLKPGDRVSFCAPLRVDPKEARRLRSLKKVG